MPSPNNTTRSSPRRRQTRGHILQVSFCGATDDRLRPSAGRTDPHPGAQLPTATFRQALVRTELADRLAIAVSERPRVPCVGAVALRPGLMSYGEIRLLDLNRRQDARQFPALRGSDEADGGEGKEQGNSHRGAYTGRLSPESVRLEQHCFVLPPRA